jgi:hypothetical protein
MIPEENLFSNELSSDAFGRAATELIRWQAGANPIYRRFIGMERGASVADMKWDDFPALPVEAFRTETVFCGPVEEAVGYFETSGTTSEAKGRHWFADLSIYRRSVLEGWRRVMPSVEGFRWVSLIPSTADRPHSSLAQMVAWLDETFGPEEGRKVFVDGNFQVDADGLAAWLGQEPSRPVVMLATTFAIAEWAESRRSTGRGPIPMAPGSLLFETGGFKGRYRELTEAEFLPLLDEVLELRADQIWNEYGMTELFSQCYRRRDQAIYTSPPWLQVRMRDPVSGELCEEGEPGLIEFFDLANTRSLAAIGTQDVGIRAGDGFRLLGRVSDADVRGCSLPYGALS